MTKQEKLIEAIREGMERQGFDQKRLASAAGVTQSMVSMTLKGNYDLKEEKWRALCGALALDYDAIVAEPDVDYAAIAEAVCSMAESAESAGRAMETMVESTTATRATAMPGGLDIVARYVAGKLREDIRHGTDMSLAELRVLLDVASMGGAMDE